MRQPLNAHVFQSRAILLRAGGPAAGPTLWIEGGGLLCQGGRVRSVLASPGSVARARRDGARVHDLGEGVLAPGTVDAHAHLELSGLEGRLPRRPFLDWVQAVIAARAQRPAARLADDAVRGAAALTAAGTTLVGDVDSSGAALAAGSRIQTRLVVHRELLDARDPARTEAALARVARALPARRRRFEGLSPHAPHTVGEDLLREAATLARGRRLPVAVHWAETLEEVRWLADGTGPFAELLGPSPHTSGLELLERAGLLGETTALVHGNHPEPGDAERIAAAGATVVHCPGCHAWFGRAPFPEQQFAAAGTRLALGTDSLASNSELDLRREMQCARSLWPHRAPEEIWGMATLEGARVLGLAGSAGELAPGSFADFALHAAPSTGPREALEALTAAAPPVLGTWIGGRRASR